VRRTLALVATAAVAALAAVIMGEYEPTVWTALATAVVLGLGLPEVPLGIARWRGRVPAAVTAACAAVSVVWAGWISAGRGLNPIRGTVWAAAIVAAVVAGLRLGRGGQQDPVAVASGHDDDPTPAAG
jgi:hypothetical protein